MWKQCFHQETPSVPFFALLCVRTCCSGLINLLPLPHLRCSFQWHKLAAAPFVHHKHNQTTACFLLKGQSLVGYCNRIKWWEDFKISAIQMPCKVTFPFLEPTIKTSPACMVSHPGTKARWIHVWGPTSSSTGVLHRDPHHPFLWEGARRTPWSCPQRQDRTFKGQREW